MNAHRQVSWLKARGSNGSAIGLPRRHLKPSERTLRRGWRTLYSCGYSSGFTEWLGSNEGAAWLIICARIPFSSSRVSGMEPVAYAKEHQKVRSCATVCNVGDGLHQK